jgi:transcriptional regulator with XRE-family HTH domain
MSEIGPRLREERERLKLTQRAFGEIGGVEPNAQGKYENGERWPRSDYLVAIAGHDVDVLYVLTGQRQALLDGQLADEEARLLASFRSLPEPARRALAGMAETIAAMVPVKKGDARVTR